MNRFIRKIRNYGLGASILIVIRKITERAFRFSWQSMYLLSMDTYGFEARIPLNGKRVVSPTLDDFNQEWKDTFLSKQKTDIFGERYTNDDTEIVGIEDEGELACVGWVYYGEVSVGGKFQLIKESSIALLYDDFTLSSHRGRHLHRILNEQRVLMACGHGCKKCYTVVYTHNKPSLNNYLKIGMKIENRFCVYHLGNRYHCTLKSTKMF